MKTLESLVRPNIWALEPYSCARDEFKGMDAHVFLDANENPYNDPINRYPDPLQEKLKERLAPLKGVRPSQIFLGNGSDEAIDLIYRIFCNPNEDNVVAIAPTYGMYKVCADINNVEYRSVPLSEDWQIDTKALLNATDSHTKVIWICSPNNPTGNDFPRARHIATSRPISLSAVCSTTIRISSYSIPSARHGHRQQSDLEWPSQAKKSSACSIR